MATTSSIPGLDKSITITRPHPGENIIISGASGKVLRLDFESGNGLIVTVVRGDLSFLFPDGGRVTLIGFYSDDMALQEFIILPDDTQVTLEAFLEQVEGGITGVPPIDRDAANSAFFEGGAESYMDDPGKLIEDLDRLGMLGTDYWGRATKHHVWEEGLATSESGRPESVPSPPVIIVPGALSAVLFMAEDGMPFKYMLASGADPATGPADTTLEAGFSPHTGMPIIMTLDPPGNPTGPNTVYVYSITMTDLPSAAQGVIFYQGVPVSAGQIIANPDLAAFSFLPAKYYSGDVPFNFTYVLATPATGPATAAQDAVGWLHIDSVADLPSAASEATGRTEDGDNLGVAAPVFNQGWATQAYQDAGTMQVTFTVSVEYYDLDGSETGWLLIALPQGFSIPAGSGYTEVSDATGVWAKVPIANLPQYKATGGVVNVPVTLTMDSSAVSGNKDLTIQAVAFETDTLNSDGHIIADNTAIRVIDQDVDVDLLAGMLTVQVGWAYENNETGGSATQNLSAIGLDSSSTTSTGAPISFTLTSGTLDQVVITLPAGSGGLYLAGMALTPDLTPAPAGYVSYTVSGTALQSNTLTFMPTGHSDADVPMSYVLTATDSNNNVFTFSGSSTIVIDAVADAGTINAPVTGVVEADNATFAVTVNATFVDIDGSERHYILLESIPGWTSPDPYDIYTVYYDSNGNALPPTAYNPGSGEYSIDISGYAYAINYMRFDVTAQSIQAQGNPENYVVRVVPPLTATDTYLNVATMSEEYPANLSGREYDLANNIAIVTEQVLINVVDTTALISATGAYENHNPDQYQGSPAPGGTDGIITVNLSANGEVYDNTAGSDDIVFTFTYNPANPTADPTPGSFYSYQTGLTYSFGNTTPYYSYTQIGPNQYQLVLHAGNIPLGSSSFRLRYNPPTDDDTDLNNITCSVPVRATGSGETRILTTDSINLVVDAVANKPTLVSVTPDYAPGYTAAASGSIIPVTLTAQFGDYLDNSEQHYLVFDLSSGFSAIDISSFPPGSVTLLTGTAISNAGLTAYTGSQYVVMQVANSYLAANNGLFSATVNATVDTVTQDSTLQLVVNAVSVDHSTDGGEITTSNNYASTQGSSSVVVHTVTSQPVLHAATAFENDIPNAHIGSTSTTHGAAALSITGIDASEVVSSITIAWNPGLGTLYYNGAPITGGTVISGITYTYDQAAGTLTLTGTSAAGVSATVISHLSFVPAYTYSDQDASLTYSGVITDTASGMTRTFGPGGSGSDIATAPVPVVVDAVAQQPTDVAGSIEYPAGYIAAYNQMNISATATFTDTADGSEKHYLLIEVKSYFDTTPQVGTDGIALLTVGYNGTTPLSPNGSGGWLNPNPSSPADQSMIATSSKTFFQIPVDSVISQFQSAPIGVPQTSGNFTVTRNADGSFTVSYNTTVFMNSANMTADFADTVATGGMSHETATITGGDSYGGKEGYLYNNTAYNLVNQTLDVAVVGTTNISVIAGWATEDNSPAANTGTYYTGNGAGILAVRSDPGVAGQDYANEQITLTFTYYCLGQYSDGSWIVPGVIVYEFPGAIAVQTIVHPSGLVEAIVIISVNDTSSIVESTVAGPNPDASYIRFVPGLQPEQVLGHDPDPTNPADYRNNYNEADIGLGYSAIAQDLASGALASVGGGSMSLVIDAVADQPVISNVQWQYGVGSDGTVYDAFSSANVTLELTVIFPDYAPDGTVSEGQYILIRQNSLMDLSPEFKLAVAQAGYVIENYTVEGDGAPYYRIPAAYFSLISGAPAGSHQYDVILPMVMSGGISEGTLDAATLSTEIKIIAQAVVEDIHGAEEDYSNNTALDTASVPDLSFAVVNTTVNPGTGYAYEDNAPNADVGNYAPPPDSEVEFTLGVTLGGSLNGGTEVASDVTINYNGVHGTLYYNAGSSGSPNWIAVNSSNGTIPAAFADAPLKFVPIRLTDGTGDIDQRIQYSLTVTDPASGASQVFSGSALVIVDAVAEQPYQPTNTAPAYSGGDSSITYNESVQFTVTANFPDFQKSADNHSHFYFLIQQPTMDWTISYPNMAAFPYDTYVYNGVTYFRVPIDPTTFDATGNASVPITLTAPPEGSLLYVNSQPLDVYALSVARDPNLGPLPNGDQGITYANNWAYSAVDSVPIVYDDGGNAPLLVVSPLYENGMPNANQLDATGGMNTTTGGGQVYLATSVPDSVSGTPTAASSVVLTWSGGAATLMNPDGTPVPVTTNPDGTVSATLQASPTGWPAVYFVPAVENSDLDIGTVTAAFYDSGNNYINTASYNAIVDAVAQVPTNLQSEFDYTAGYTAAPPDTPVNLTVSTVFGDPSANEDHYVLVQFQFGWSLPPGVSYPIIDGPNGDQYWQVPVNVSDINQSTGAYTTTVQVIPPASGGTPGANGQVSYDLSTGAMTVRIPTGGTDQEYTSANNVSYNLTGTAQVVLSAAESDPVLNVTSTYAGDDPTGSGVPNPNVSSNLYISGLNQGSDNIPQVVLQFNNSNGDVTYNGVSLNGLSGVTYTVDASGNVTATITNPAIINALTSGSAGHSAVRYVPSTYNDKDVPVSATITVNDNFSPDSETVGNTSTIIVDAVAQQPTNVSMDIPGYTGAVIPGTTVPVSVTATFPDLLSPSGSIGQHYMAIQQVAGWDVAGGLPPTIAVETYNGITYYLVSVDLFGNGGSPYLVNNGDGSYTFTLPLSTPNYTSDVHDAVTISGGAVTVQTPIDQEVTFNNNTAVTSTQLPINVGVVQTTAVDFTISGVTEDSATGAVISLNQAMLNTLNANNESVMATTLNFSGDFTGYAAGTQVGTIIYNGIAIPVISNGNGTASATINFGPGGYSSSNNPTLIWGTVATDGSGNVIYSSPGVPQVTQWNHTGSNMTVSSSSTVQDNASLDTKTGVPGSSSVAWTPTADAPTDLNAANPANAVGADTPVTFTVSGIFADIDGSEQHYYLVQQLPGWTGNYQTMLVNGETYFVIPISNSTTANPSVNVTLNTPAGITVDGSYTLIVSGMSVDGASTNTSSVTTTTTVQVGVVNATGVSLTMAATNEYDGGAVPGTQMQFNWIGTPQNDSLNNITITDLQGGVITDAAGNVLFTGAPAILDGATALSGGYYYLPPEYGKGNYTLTFSATASDNASNASTTFTGQTGTVTVNPVSTVPGDPSGLSSPPVDEAGHQTQVTVNLQANFNDYTGTEDHFFLVQLPAGVTPPAGWTAVTAVSDPVLYSAATGAGWSGVFYKVEAAANGTASFAVTIPENTPASAITVQAGSTETSLSPPQYVFSPDAAAVDLPAVGLINLPPDSVQETQTVADSSGAQVSGAIPLTDPDADTVTVTSVTVNGTTIPLSGGAYTYTDVSGTFSFDPSTGDYTYTASGGGTGSFVFAVTVSDGLGGVSTSNITVDVGVSPLMAAFAGEADIAHAEDAGTGMSMAFALVETDGADSIATFDFTYERNSEDGLGAPGGMYNDKIQFNIRDLLGPEDSLDPLLRVLSGPGGIFSHSAGRDCSTAGFSECGKEFPLTLAGGEDSDIQQNIIVQPDNIFHDNVQEMGSEEAAAILQQILLCSSNAC